MPSKFNQLGQKSNLLYFHIAVLNRFLYRKVRGTSMYKDYTMILATSFTGANDNSGALRNELIVRPDFVLIRAIKADDLQTFKTALAIHKFHQRQIDRTMFFITGYDRGEAYIQPLKDRRAKNTDIEEQLDGKMLRCVRHGDLAGVYDAIEEGANIHAYGEECLKHAFLGNHADIVEALLDKGANMTIALSDISFQKSFWGNRNITQKTKDVLFERLPRVPMNNDPEDMYQPEMV
jgi:hypothetical protein